MFARFLLLLSPLTFLVSTFCFAEIVEVHTSEPDDSHLGMKIDLHGREFVKRLTVDKNRYLLVNKGFTDIRISKDPKTKLNHFNALIAYNLYKQGLNTTDTRFLYLQCPIVRKTYVDRTKPITNYSKIDSKKFSLSFEGDSITLKEELVDPGFYKFLSLPRDKVPKISTDFPMLGKVSEHYDMELMCANIQLIYAIYKLDESNRNIVLQSTEDSINLD